MTGGLPPLPDAAVVVRASAPDWRAALGLVAGALAASGSTGAAYGRSMTAMVEQHGPYIVIAPGLALAHARPGPDVLRDGLAVVTLASPVAFGHPHNDPVRVVLGVAVASTGAHLDSSGALADLFADPTVTGRLAEAATADEIRAIMGVTA
jgi:PTS system ascorbate-specific IIA component